MARDPLKNLKRLERQELRDRARAEAAEQRALRRVERRERRREAWPRWTAWWEKRAAELKIAATVVGSVGIIATGAVGAVKNAGAAWRWAKRVVGMYRAIDHARADRAAQPPTPDVATLATDRFEREHPPDAGSKEPR